MATDLPQPRPRGARPKWTEPALRRELGRILADWPYDRFPTSDDLTSIKSAGFARALQKHGGLGRWAIEFGLTPSRPRSTYGWDEARRDVEQVIAEWGVLPGRRRLELAGYHELARFLVNRAGGNRQRLLTTLGYEEGAIAQLTDSRRTRRRRRWTAERIEREARALLKAHDEWPPNSFFEKAGARKLLQAIRYHGGREYWAMQLGLPLYERSPSGIGSARG